MLAEVPLAGLSFEASFPLCNGTSVADDGDAIAAWIARRIDDYFAPFNSADP